MPWLVARAPLDHRDAALAQTRGGTLKISYAEPAHLNTAIASGTPTGFPATQLFTVLARAVPVRVPAFS